MKHHIAAQSLIAEVEQYVAWLMPMDEALQTAINVIFKEASEDARASLYASIVESVQYKGKGWDIATVQKHIEKHIV